MKICTALVAFFSISIAFAQAPKPAMQTAPKPAGPVPSAVAPAPASPSTVDPNRVVLTIGEDKITASQYDDLIATLPEQYQQFARGAGKRQFAENLIQLKLLSKEAEQRKLDKTSKVERQLAFQRQNILAQLMFQDLQNTVKVDDAAVQKYFDEHKNDYESAKARHILIRMKGAPMPATEGKPELTEEQALAKAQAIRKRLAGGEDFATVAKAESDDAQSGAQGGDLGSFKHGMMVPPFEQAAFSLPIGQISEPVKSPFGFHIIRVDSRESKTLAEAKPDIEKKLRPELARKQIEAIRAEAKVTMDDSFFGPAAPALPPGPAK